MGDRRSRKSLHRRVCETTTRERRSCSLHLSEPNEPIPFAARAKKNDVVDAINVARALLANPELPVLQSLDSQRELQELSRAQRRLSEQLKSNRGALKELTDDSPVREIVGNVIRTLITQLKELQRQIHSLVSRVMPRLLGFVSHLGHSAGD